MKGNVQQSKPLGIALIGPYGPAQIACIRTWRGKSTTCFIHIETGGPSRSIARCVESYLHMTPTQMRSPEGIRALKKFCVDNNCAGIVCVSYGMALWLHSIHDELAPTGIWTATPEVISQLRSKQRLTELATQAGMSVLPTAYFTCNDVTKAKQLSFPIVVRPTFESTEMPPFKVRRFDNYQQLSDFVSSLKNIADPLIAQPYINGNNYVVHGVRETHGRAIQLQGFLVTSMMDGLTLSIHASELPIELKKQCESYCESIGIVGVFHFEFVIDSETKTYYFMELNGRLGGTTNKVWHCGYQEPAFIPFAFSAIQQCPPSKTNTIIATNKKTLLQFVWKTFRNSQGELDYPRRAQPGSVRQLFAGLFFWKDEIVSLPHANTTLAYYIESMSQISIKTSLSRLAKKVFGDYLVFMIFRCDLPNQSPRSEEGLCISHHPGEATTEIGSYAGEDAYGFTYSENGEALCNCWVWYGNRYRTERNFWPLQPDEAKLIALETHEAARGRGLAPELLRYVHQQMSKQGFHRLFARIWHSNKASSRAFVKAGWVLHAVVVEFRLLGKNRRLVLKNPFS